MTDIGQGHHRRGAWLRRLWWKRVRRYRYEICHDCGRPVGLVWQAADALWLWVVGHEGGILCIRCFDQRCDEDAYVLRWVPEKL